MMLKAVYVEQEAQTVHARAKVEAVKPVTEGGMTIAQAARDLDISPAFCNAGRDSSGPILLTPFLAWAPEARTEELRRLLLENARLRQERDIIKAIAICPDRHK
jgi:transposase-like protein